MEDDQIEQRPHITGFRVVHVFDISQTDGDPIPVPEFPAVQVPDVELRQQLIHAAEAAGYTVVVVPRPRNDVRGSYNRHNKTIELSDGYEPASQIRTLLHELAHACDPEIDDPDSDREERELVAESAAYLVGTDMGLDMAEASAPLRHELGCRRQASAGSRRGVSRRCQGGRRTHRATSVARSASALTRITPRSLLREGTGRSTRSIETAKINRPASAANWKNDLLHSRNKP